MSKDPNPFEKRIQENVSQLIWQANNYKEENQHLRNLIADKLIREDKLVKESAGHWSELQRVKSLLVEIRRLSDPDYVGHKAMTDGLRLENVYTYSLLALANKREIGVFGVDSHVGDAPSFQHRHHPRL